MTSSPWSHPILVTPIQMMHVVMNDGSGGDDCNDIYDEYDCEKIKKTMRIAWSIMKTRIMWQATKDEDNDLDDVASGWSQWWQWWLQVMTIVKTRWGQPTAAIAMLRAKRLVAHICCTSGLLAPNDGSMTSASSNWSAAVKLKSNTSQYSWERGHGCNCFFLSRASIVKA